MNEKKLTDEKGRVNITDLVAEEVEAFILENRDVIIERAMKRLKEIKKNSGT